MIYNPINEFDFDVELSDLERLSEAVLARYGYDFSNYAQSSFKRRVLMLMKKNGIKQFDLLLNRMMNDVPFFEQCVLDITVNTTEMFRDPTCFLSIRKQVVPVLASRPEFNVWHAACSTGEEVLSMAILMHEEGVLNQARVYATDINQVVMRKASELRFPIRNKDLFTQNYLAAGGKAKLEDYYKVVDNEMVFDKYLIQNVKFKHHDLAVDHHFYKFDLVFCRNVLIYFNQQLQNRVFDLLHQSMFLGGMLVLGSKESLIWCRIADKFDTVNEQEKIFKKVKL